MAYAFTSIRDQKTRHAKVEGWLSRIEKVTKLDAVKAEVVYARAKLASEEPGTDPEFPVYNPDNARALALYNKVVAKYPKSEAAKRAKVDINEAAQMMVGKLAPDIVGEDQNGEKIKLSDYKGKVVVLDFWGFW